MTGAYPKNIFRRDLKKFNATLAGKAIVAAVGNLRYRTEYRQMKRRGRGRRKGIDNTSVRTRADENRRWPNSTK